MARERYGKQLEKYRINLVVVAIGFTGLVDPLDAFHLGIHSLSKGSLYICSISLYTRESIDLTVKSNHGLLSDLLTSATAGPFLKDILEFFFFTSVRGKYLCLCQTT